jgi:NMD protein affecting ribosome stability and mRNA decay
VAIKKKDRFTPSPWLLKQSAVGKMSCDECGAEQKEWHDPHYTVCPPCDLKLYNQSLKQAKYALTDKLCQRCSFQLPPNRYFVCPTCVPLLEPENEELETWELPVHFDADTYFTDNLFEDDDLGGETV